MAKKMTARRLAEIVCDATNCTVPTTGKWENLSLENRERYAMLAEVLLSRLEITEREQRSEAV